MEKLGDFAGMLEKNMPGAPRAESSPGREPSASPMILVLDELDEKREMLRALLEDDGYLVLSARRACEGLEILNRAPVDLVLLDMRLTGVDGPEFCRRLR